MEISAQTKKTKIKKKKHTRIQVSQWPFHLLLLPGVLFVFIFHVLPMFGIVMAFQDFIPAKGFLNSPFVGLKHFQYMLEIPDSKQIFANTLIIAIGKVILGLIVPVIFALILNEARITWIKKSVQTIVYLPNFLSWVALGTVFTLVFSYDGLFNNFLQAIGIHRISFLTSNTWFRPFVILTDVWKGYGYSTIIYLAALTSIDPSLYESASIDGATKFQQMKNITLPSLVPTIVLLATLSLGNVLNAGFDQIFNLYNPLVYQTGDIIDTYVYRMGLVNMEFSFSAAVGLLKSTISCILIVISYKLADKFAGYRLF